MRSLGYVDLNADLGEEIGDDQALLGVVTSANVACGAHAGTRDSMARVCDEAARRSVTIGAHVSYADRAGFGRVARDIDAEVLTQQVADQIGVLREQAQRAGVSVAYLKPHGALYHRVHHDHAQAEAVLAGSGQLPVLAMPGALIAELARAGGRAAYTEGFPDRGYDEGGGLIPRDQPGALIVDADEVAVQALRLATQVDSVCVHGDSPDAVAHARAVGAALQAAGFQLRPFLDPEPNS